MSPTVGVPGPRMALAVVLGMRMAAHTTAEIADELADLPLDITFAVEDRTCEEFARWLLLRQRTGCLVEGAAVVAVVRDSLAGRVVQHTCNIQRHSRLVAAFTGHSRSP
jgi:hypothetical protein